MKKKNPAYTDSDIPSEGIRKFLRGAKEIIYRNLHLDPDTVITTAFYTPGTSREIILEVSWPSDRRTWIQEHKEYITQLLEEHLEAHIPDDRERAGYGKYSRFSATHHRSFNNLEAPDYVSWTGAIYKDQIPTMENPAKGSSKFNIEKFKELVRQGLSVEEIASSIGISIDHAYKTARRLGLPFKPVITPEIVGKMLAMASYKKTRNEIAEALNLDPTTVGKYLKKEGITFDRPAPMQKEILKLIYEGKSNTEIQKLLGVSSATVWHTEKRYGVKAKKQPRGGDRRSKPKTTIELEKVNRREERYWQKRKERGD